ncbi:uncharacterized protein [Gossypium hirsutum]|uniref:Tf2-1-like SH3-like domain-containing protein n=1 Tax=Gossypium hirsutum TaxID=3635 RepID=A0ABM2ZI42_GOSHI|nr:uncharacterized protein LOC121213605 [Gossypium hirsutum]
MVGEKLLAWVSWLPLAEWWYNTTYHSAIQTTPYEALYGQITPLHLPYIAGETPVDSVDRTLQQREAMRKVGDLVYLKLQPYRQHSLHKFRNQKLSPQYFRPFPMEARVRNVAYRLSLLSSARIYPNFHVSQLKKHIGSAVSALTFPQIGSNGALPKSPV